MEKYCQNPLCENEATKVVPVSVDRPSDQKRSLCAVCEEVYTWGVQHGRMSKAGLPIDPPPKETGPERLYRVVYLIDIGAANPQQAAQRVHAIMADPASLAPVLHVLDSRGRETTIDLAAVPPGASIQGGSDASQEKAREFVLAGGTQCPQCRSSDLDCEAVELDEQCAYQEVNCRKCQLQFFAVYRLAGYGLHVGDAFEVHTITEGFGRVMDRRKEH